MEQTKPKTDFATPLLIFIGGLSAYNLFNYRTDLINLSCLVSLIGVTASVLYFLKVDRYKILVYIWTFAQVIVIDKSVFDPATNITYHNSLLDMTQVYSMKFGLDLGLESGKLSIQLNIISILLIGLLKGLPEATKASDNVNS